MVELLSISLHCTVMPDAFVLFLQITCQAYQISSPRQIIDHLKKIQLLILIMSMLDNLHVFSLVYFCAQMMQ